MKMKDMCDEDLKSRMRIVLEDGQCADLREHYFQQVCSMLRDAQNMDSDWIRADENGIYFVSMRSQPLPLVVHHPNGIESVHIVLDQSSSMASVLDAVYQGTTELIEQLRPDAMVRVTKFATTVELGIQSHRDQILDWLRSDARVACGMTALNDAIIKVIQSEEEASSNNDTMTIIILTDGQDTCSKNVQSRAYEVCTNFQKNPNHRIIFMGSKQDAIASAEQIGIPVTRALTINHTEANIRNAFNAASQSISRHQSSGDDAFTQAERSHALVS